MKVVEFSAENFKKLRVVEISPKGHVVELTGKTGQGKTSVLDAVWAGLVGKRATPDKPVRRGAQKAKIKIGLGEERTEILVTRKIGVDGTQQLEVEYVDPKTRPSGTPQALLDELFSELTFDPMAFVRMPTKSKDKAVKSKLDVLKSVVKLDVDLDELAAADKVDFEERTEKLRETRALQSQLETISVQAGLPKAKVNDAAILTQISDADGINRKAYATNEKKRMAIAVVETKGREHLALQEHLLQTARKIDDLRKQVDEAVGLFDSLSAREQIAAADRNLAEIEAAAMESGQFVDVSELGEQLKQAQIINREIEKRDRYEAIKAQRETAQKRAEVLTRQIEARAEKKTSAFEKATLPVDGLTFDEEGVLYNGVPIEQAGGAEQIRVSTALAMAMNHKLRILRIDNGESMDEDDMGVIAEMAAEHDYQLWISRVDSSGKVGIVIEDGEVKSVNER